MFSRPSLLVPCSPKVSPPSAPIMPFPAIEKEARLIYVGLHSTSREDNSDKSGQTSDSTNRLQEGRKEGRAIYG